MSRGQPRAVCQRYIAI